ncbi:MAG: hypothetical protein K2M91_02765, partial [Lachnospiraceae bacterium]|nr:hypothetical protein [Lachnospiraceae bacterium]
MPLFLTMSLFGSIGTLFYIIVQPLTKKYLSVQWRRYYLICNILEYLIPFPYFHTKYRELLSFLWRVQPSNKSTEKEVYTDYTANIIQIAPHRIYISDWIVYILIIGVIIVGLGILFLQICRYRRIQSLLRNNV